MFFHIPTLRHDTYFLNGKSQQNQTCVATTGFPSSVYTTVLFEENAYDFFFRGGGGGGGGGGKQGLLWEICKLRIIPKSFEL